MVALKPGPIPKQGMPAKKKKGMRRYEEELEGPLTPREWVEAIAKRHKIFGSRDLRCPVSGVLFPWWQMDFHHPYEKSALRNARLFHLVWDPRNGIPVAPAVHARHHLGIERIPGRALHPLNLEFAAELGQAELDLVKSLHP